MIRRAAIAVFATLISAAAYAQIQPGNGGGGGGVLTPTNMNLTGNIAYGGAVAGPANSWMSLRGPSLTGIVGGVDADGWISPMNFYIGNDIADTQGVGLAMLNVEDGVGSGTWTGGRVAIHGYVAITGSPASTPGSGLTGIQGNALVNANLGGATGAYANYKGTVFGGNSQVIAQGSATFISLINAHEFDVECQTGCSVAEKHGITIVQTANDAVAATYDDSAVEIANQDAASVNWTYGVSFGAYAHKWPFSTSSTLIGAQTRSVGSPVVAPVANYGIDFSNITFSTAQIKGSNWLLDPSGNMFVGRTTVLTIGDVASFFKANNGIGGITIDNNNAGTAAFTVINIGNGNATTEAQIRLNGSSFSGGLGANGFSIGVAASGAAMEIGTGSETLQLGSSGMFTADATTTACVGTLGPSGIHATVQKWLTIKDNGGTVGYIPVC